MTASEYWSLYAGSGGLSTIEQRVYHTMCHHEAKTATLSLEIEEYQSKISQLEQ